MTTYRKAAILRINHTADSCIMLPVTAESENPNGPWQVADCSDYPVLFELAETAESDDEDSIYTAGKDNYSLMLYMK